MAAQPPDVPASADGEDNVGAADRAGEDDGEADFDGVALGRAAEL
jgi:hypothetical protein